MDITRAHTPTFTPMHMLNTHAHTYMLARTATSLTGVQHDGSEDGTARRGWTTSRTALSAVTTGVSVLSGQDPWSFGWVGLACQTAPCHWRQMN